MEEARYVYGYQNGWNVENEYLNKVNSLLIDYSEQKSELERINSERQLIRVDIERAARDISDEELRKYYEEDGINTPFDTYKKNYEEEVEQRRKDLNLDLERNNNRYNANLYYLTQEKDKLRKELIQERKNLQNKLDQVRLDLTQISLNQRSVPTTESEKSLELRDQYDKTFLEMQKLEHALNKIDESLEEMELTGEESRILISGLNPQEEKEYKLILERKKDKTPEPIVNDIDDDSLIIDVEEYNRKLEEYKKNLEEYKKDCEKLGEYLEKYNKGEIPYDEYKTFANPIFERYSSLNTVYNELNKDYEELSKKIDENQKEISLKRYSNSGFTQNFDGYYFNIAKNDYEEGYKPWEDILYNPFLRGVEPPEKPVGVKVLLEKIEKNKDIPVQEQQDKPNKLAPGKIKITFLNGGFAIKNYDNIIIERGTVIHGPVIPPTILNKKGQPKKVTAQVFDCWVDKYGNEVDLTKPITKDMVLNAKYKFDIKKATAVGLGAAVGAVAFTADLAVPIPIPVISMLGATGFGIGSRFAKKRLTNLMAENEKQALEITAVDDIPESLKQEIEHAKKNKYINTFLKTAAVACTISSLAHGLKNTMVKANAMETVPTKSIPEPIEPTNTSVLGGYEPNGSVFRTAQDALNGTNGINPYKPAFAGKETFEAFFNGKRVLVQEGQSIQEILNAVGATDPSQVAINVMNSEGIPLTWQPLTELVETAAKTVVR